jgi:small ligand-binding sensory domain FIST
LSENEHGAVLFSCLGRGSPLYGEVNHDSAALERHLARFGGFFCNGEIGPVEEPLSCTATRAFAIFRARTR